MLTVFSIVGQRSSLQIILPGTKADTDIRMVILYSWPYAATDLCKIFMNLFLLSSSVSMDSYHYY